MHTKKQCNGNSLFIKTGKKKVEDDFVGNNQLIFVLTAVVVVNYKLCKEKEGKKKRVGNWVKKSHIFSLCVFLEHQCLQLQQYYRLVNWVKPRNVFFSYDSCGINNNDFGFFHTNEADTRLSYKKVGLHRAENKIIYGVSYKSF